MHERLKALREERLQIDALQRKIAEKAAAEKRDFTADESQEWDKADERFHALGKDIGRLESLMERERSSGSATATVDPQFRGNRGAARDADPLAQRLADRLPVQLPIQLGGRAQMLSITPDSPIYPLIGEQYERAFSAYLQGRGMQAALQVGSNPKGGYLAPAQFTASLIKFLDDEVFMRRISRVLPPLATGASLGAPSWDTDPGDADWSAEVPASDISEDTSAAVGGREFVPHLATKRVDASMKLLRASVIDVDSLIRERLGFKFAVTEEKGFLSGNGSQRPLGIYTANAQGISTSRDVTAAGSSSVVYADLVDALYNLKGPYQQRASWVVHREFIKRVRKIVMAGGTGIPLWEPSLAAGEPDRILGRPFYMSEFAPSTFTTGQYVAVVGDFSTGYWIVDSLQFEVQVLDQVAALKNKIVFLGRKETDGMPVLEECFSRLKLA